MRHSIRKTPWPADSSFPFDTGGRYDARDAMILWDEKDGRISRVTVVPFPAHRIGPESPLWKRWRRFSGKWQFAFGSISPGWMRSKMARPAAVFSYFIGTDFATPGEETRAYAEFARIRECAWARVFLARRRPDGRVSRAEAPRPPRHAKTRSSGVRGGRGSAAASPDLSSRGR